MQLAICVKGPASSVVINVVHEGTNKAMPWTVVELSFGNEVFDTDLHQDYA